MSSTTGAHEVGHTLGLVHDSKGLMTSTSSDSNRSGSVNKRGVSDMIKYPLKGKVNSESTASGGTVYAGKGNVVNNTSSKNGELKKGKVE